MIIVAPSDTDERSPVSFVVSLRIDCAAAKNNITLAKESH